MFKGGNEQRRAPVAKAAAVLAPAALAMALALLLAACKPRQEPRVLVPAAPVIVGATQFRVDGEASQLRFYLHADGPLARVGHSHVISAHSLEGSVWLQPRPERSACELHLPVNAFVVDDPQERAVAGQEYAPPLDAADRAGTRAHMLGERQLDAAHFPVIGLRCLRLVPAPGGMSVEFAVTLRGHTAQLRVPLRWEQRDDTLRASGEFRFRQGELGLEPYSLLLGALRVADEIQARFLLVARRVGASPIGAVPRADATPRG